MARPPRVTTPSPETPVVNPLGQLKTMYFIPSSKQEDPGSAANIAAAAVNLFYITNMVHDITYRYGFTEKAGNFQKNNFRKGGKGNDAITINVLNPSDTNNAEFLTPPDGQPGVMNMFRFTCSTPIAILDLTMESYSTSDAHGILNRLTGGPATGGCLNTVEARGLGEGWSDFIAMIFLAKESDTAMTEIPIGAYVKNNPKVYWNLVTKHGFAKNLYKAEQSEGNIVAMRIIIGGMMIQSCNPTFLAARDAIIAADKLYYKSAHK
ncbi:hypothetical protein BSLG_010845 [Batrachochytrium salamandrivorans]|nr:hypothetical protein BSLG_010845 [Batrachochytrium salamandrivorans]